jgi:hypothetical protein
MTVSKFSKIDYNRQGFVKETTTVVPHGGMGKPPWQSRSIFKKSQLFFCMDLNEDKLYTKLAFDGINSFLVQTFFI